MPLEKEQVVLVSSRKLKKKNDARGRLFKSTTENTSFLNKYDIFLIIKTNKNSNDTAYHLTKRKSSENILKSRFLRK